MKICNSCMQLTGGSTSFCPVCKMSDFTDLSEDSAVRERQVGKLRQKNGLSNPVNLPTGNPRNWSTKSRPKSPRWLTSLMSFLAGSLVLSILLNSTIWSSEGNPLDVKTWLSQGGWVSAIGTDLQIKWERATQPRTQETALTNPHSLQDSQNTPPARTEQLLVNINNAFAGEYLGEPLVTVYIDVLNDTSSFALFDALMELQDEDGWSYPEIGAQLGKPYCDNYSFGQIRPGDTHTFTLCFRVPEVTNFTLNIAQKVQETLYLGDTLPPLQFHLAADFIKTESVLPTPRDLPDKALPGVGKSVNVDGIEITLNSVRLEGDVYILDITTENFTSETVNPVSYECLDSTGSHDCGYLETLDVELRGDDWSAIGPAKRVRYEIAVHVVGPFEIRFFTWDPDLLLTPHLYYGAFYID